MNSCISAIPFDEYSKILTWAERNRVLYLTLTGGEPFLCSNFCLYYENAVLNGFVVSIFTNGSMIPDLAMESLCKYHPCVIEISMYGMSNKTYQMVTGNSSGFNQVVSNVRRLMENKIPIILKYVVTNVNIDDVQLFVSWTNDNKIPYRLVVANLPLQVANKPEKIDSTFRISHSQLVELSKNNPEKIAILPFGSRASCDLGRILHFDSSGKIFGCPTLQMSRGPICLNMDWSAIASEYTQFKDECIFCPAWEKVESREQISEFLYGSTS